MRVGKLIKRQITAGKMSQRELAKRIRMDHASVQRYIEGTPVPSDKIHIIAESLYDNDEVGRRNILRQWQADKDLRDRSDLAARRMQYAKRMAKRRYHAEIVMEDFSDDSDEGEDYSHFDPLVPTVRIYRKTAKKAVQSNPIIIFSTLRKFSAPLGESDMHNGKKFSLEQHIIRYQAYCDRHHLPHEALIVLARDAILLDPFLSGSSYRRTGFFLVHHKQATHWKEKITKFVSILASDKSTNKERRIATEALCVVAEELSHLEEEIEERELVRKELLLIMDEALEMVGYHEK